MLNLVVRRLGAESGAAAVAAHCVGYGQPIVLMHGGAGSHTHWTRNLAALAEAGAVCALDLPGFGASEVPAQDVDPDAYLDRLAAAVDEIRREAGPIVLVGFSFGGACAAETAARLGEHVRGLILVGPGGFSPPKGRTLNLRSIPDDAIEAREAARRNLATMMLSHVPAADSEAVDLYLRNVARARFDSRRISLRPSLLSTIKQIDAPLLMIWGTEDPLAAPGRLSDRIAACRAARPDARIEVLPGAGHWAMYEAADAFNALALAFIAGLDAPSTSSTL